MRKRFNKQLAIDYILESIEDSEDYPSANKTDAEKLEMVLNEFKHWDCEYEKKRLPNLQDRFASWLSGLPSVINIDFENYRILEIAKKWESLPENPTERQEDKVISNWFNFISFHFFYLCRRLKVDYTFLF